MPRAALATRLRPPLSDRCVVELFVWLRVGGAKERIHLRQLRGSGGFVLATFDASKARCFKEKDKQHLLAVIESGFGDVVPFNRCVRTLLSDAAAPKLRPEDFDNADTYEI